MQDQPNADMPITGVVWSVSHKLRGIGELMKCQQGSCPTSGIGSILLELADQLDDVEDRLEAK